MGVRKDAVVYVSQVEAPDKSSKKDRRVIVLETDGNFFECVVTGSFRGDIKRVPTDCVLIPSRPDGHPQTTFTQPTVAICRWVQRFHIDRLMPDLPKGRISPDRVHLIIQTINLLISQRNENSDAADDAP